MARRKGYLRLDCSWPLNEGGLNRDAEVIKLVGRSPSDSGAGFGERDIGWVYELEQREQCLADFRKLGEAGYACSWTEYTADSDVVSSTNYPRKKER